MVCSHVETIAPARELRIDCRSPRERRCDICKERAGGNDWISGVLGRSANRLAGGLLVGVGEREEVYAQAAARMESLPTDMGKSVDGFVGRDGQFSSGHVKSETSPGHLSDDMRK